MKWRSVAPLLAILASSTASRADDWCDRIFENVCESGNAARKRVASLTEVVTQAELQARQEMQDIFRLSSPELDLVLAGKHRREEKPLIAFNLRRARLAHLMKPTLAWSDSAVKPAFARARELLKVATLSLELEHEISSSQSRKMHEILDSVQYFDTAAIFARMARDATFEFQVFEAVKNVTEANYPSYRRDIREALFAVGKCGEDGMLTEVNFFPMEGQPMVSICPGQVLMDVASASKDEELVEPFLFVLAHEIGHSINSTNGFFQKLHQPFLGCIAEKHGPSLTNDPTATRHASEITADAWAGRALREYLSEIPEEKVRRNSTRIALQWLCPAKESDQFDQGSHPKPLLRLQMSFFNSSKTRAMLGCTLPARPLGCGLGQED